LSAARKFTQASGGNQLLPFRPSLTGYRIRSSEKTYVAVSCADGVPLQSHAAYVPAAVMGGVVSAARHLAG